MKKITTIITALIIFMCGIPLNILTVSAETEMVFEFKGSGTEADPFRIESAYQLGILAEKINNPETYDEYADKYYIQTVDIDLNDLTDKPEFPIGDAYDASENKMIWNHFKGNYNGNYHKITNFNCYSERKDRYIGLFGRVVRGKISNLSVYGEVNAENCRIVGGIAGEICQGASIVNCSFNGSVKGNDTVGGLAGYIYDGGYIYNSYANTDVSSAGERAGGVVGSVHVGDYLDSTSNAEVKNNYFVGRVSGNNNGGITGDAVISNTVPDCTIKFENNYYLKTACDGAVRGASSAGCSGLSENLMKESAELLGNPFVNNTTDFNDGYPVFEWQSTPYQFKGSGTAEDPYQISSKEELEIMRDLVNSLYFGRQHYANCHYIQTADIDLENELWEPIGTRMADEIDCSRPSFGGNYNGNFHTIKGLKVNKTGGNRFAGLFGSVDGNLAIENLIVYGEVKGDKDIVGGICGEIVNGNCTVRNCAFIGNATGYETVGGIVGFNAGSIENCYHIGDITATTGSNVGGITGIILLVSQREKYINIKNCYNIGKVIGNDIYSGAIVGNVMYENYEGKACVENCYYLKDDVATGGNGEYEICDITALPSSMLKKVADELGMPFVDNNNPKLNDGYPVFFWQTGIGDVNADGVFNIADAVMLEKWILGFGELTNWHNADLNEDNIIDSFDLVIMRKLIIS